MELILFIVSFGNDAPAICTQPPIPDSPSLPRDLHTKDKVKGAGEPSRGKSNGCGLPALICASHARSRLFVLISPNANERLVCNMKQ
jgi:hypothetical protein